MVTILLLAPPYTTENLTGVSVPMLYRPRFPGTAGTIKKYMHCTIAQLFYRFPGRWGGHGYKWLNKKLYLRFSGFKQHKTI